MHTYSHDALNTVAFARSRSEQNFTTMGDNIASGVQTAEYSALVFARQFRKSVVNV